MVKIQDTNRILKTNSEEIQKNLQSDISENLKQEEVIKKQEALIKFKTLKEKQAQKKEREENAQKSGITLIKADSDIKTAIVGRNDPCPCGSGKKYKKCCG